jgi:hypothetical protein
VVAESFDPTVARVVGAALPQAQIIGPAHMRRVTRVVRLRPGFGLGAIEGGELVVASLDALHEVGWPQPAIQRLARGAVAGVIVVGESREQPLEFEPPIPIVIVEGSASQTRQIEEALAAAVARARRDLYDYAQRLQHHVVEVAIAGASLEDVVRALARTSGRCVVVRAGERLLHRSPIGWLSPTTIPPEVIEGTNAAPIRHGDQVLGWCALYTAEHADAGWDEEALAVARGAMACSIVLARTEPESPLLALLDPERDWSSAARELERRGHDLNRKQVAVALRPADTQLLAAYQKRWPHYVFALQEQTLLVLAGGVSGAALAEQLVALRLGGSAAWSVEGSGVDAAAQALQHALAALELAGVLGLTIASYEQLAADLLLQHVPAERALAYIQEVLGPLAAPDHERERTTLMAYIAANRNAAAAAETLHLHRNTILYRLRTIEQELGRPLDDATTLFEVELALRLQRLFKP